VSDAAQQAGITPDFLEGAVAHIGIAGVMTPRDSAEVAAALPYGDVTVTDDRPTAVAGALGGKHGFLLAVGTGTIVAASTADGFQFVSGWGFQVSDQGSGAWLGRAALEQVLLCHDGIAEHTRLTRTLFAKYSNDPNEVVTFSTAAKPGDFGSLAFEVITHAKADDPFGQDLMARGAGHLTRALAALGFQSGDRLCLSGGVGPHYADYLPKEYQAGYVDACGSALDGAFQLATVRLASLEGA
jgi:glucosamine kinase